MNWYRQSQTSLDEQEANKKALRYERSQNPIAREVRKSLNTDLISCPFCNERDFDLVGLKSHLMHGDCELFNGLENTERLF